MRRGILVLFAVLLMSIAFTPGMVAAAYWFNFNYSGTGVTSSGTLTTEEISSGIYHIIGISEPATVLGSRVL